MKEAITEVLRSHFRLNNDTLERLKVLLKEVEEDKQKILTMFMTFFKDDVENGNNLLEELFQDIKTNCSLAPDLNHLLITKKIYQYINGEVKEDDEYAFEEINRFVKELFPNLEAIVKNSVDSLGEDIDLEDQNELISVLKLYELNNIETDDKTSNSDKEQENALFEEIQRQDMEALRKSLENALKDIKEMNCTTIKEYFFVSAEIECIQQELLNKFESFNAENFPRTFELIKLIESRKESDPEVIKAFDEMKNGQDVKRNILVLKKRICGIDFNELFRMMAEARYFQKEQMETIEKRNRNRNEIKAVSFFGLSKVGKSTLIKRLMGYKMKETQINGINTIQVEDPSLVKFEHYELKIGASNKSTTRIPRLYLLPTNNSEEEDIYLFDCPGAEDSESIEVEISNRITTIEALKEVDELYIAIVLSDKIQGLNGEGFEKLARAVDGFVKNYREIKESILIIFNGGTEKYLEAFYHNIQDIRKNIKNRNNYAISKNFEAFFDHLESQSKKRKQMFVVNPLDLELQNFLEEIPAKGIRNCEDALVGKLGERCETSIDNSAEKLRIGFEECFENDDIEGASYYFAMLHKIALEDKIALYGNREIRKIGEQMFKKIEESIKSFKKEVENLKILRMKKEDRKIEMKNLKEKHERIKNNLSKITVIKKESSNNKEPFQKLHQSLENIIKDTETWFLNEIQKWKSENFDLKEVSEITEIFMEFLTCFELEKKQFDKNVDEIKGEILNEMKEHFKNREKNHKMKENLLKFTSIHKLTNKKFTIPLVDEIKGTFEKLKEPISIINWNYLHEPKSIKEDVITLKMKTDNNNEQEVKKINEFLNFIVLMKGYPKEMKNEQEEQMTKVESYLSKYIPEFFISKLDNIIEDDQLTEKPQQDNIKIKSLEGIIKNLKFLDNIEAIKTYQNNKISENFNKLEEIIEKNIKKIEEIKEAFKKDNVDDLKRDLEKVILDMKKLKNMVCATGKEDLKQKRDELEKSFYEEVDTFINRNKFGQRLVFERPEFVGKNILKLYKLIEFKGIFKIPNEKTNELLNTIIKEGEDKIIEPISSYSKQLKESQVFICVKLNHCFNYYETCKRECETIEKSDVIERLEQAMVILIKTVKDIYESTVEKPVKKLKEDLSNYKKKEVKNEEEEMMKLFDLKQVYECKKALKKLKEMETLKYQELDLDYLSLQSEIEEAFKDFALNQIAKIKENLGISALNELEENVDMLKEMERSFLNDFSAEKERDVFQLKKLSDSINEQKANFKETQKSHLEIFEKIKKIEDLKNFDSYAFYTAYKEFEKDKSIVGSKNMDKLKSCLQFYFNLAGKSCQELNSEVEGNPLSLSLEYEASYYKSLKFIILFMENFTEIKLHIPDLQEKCELNLEKIEKIFQKLIGVIVENIKQFLSNIEKEINKLKNKDIEQIELFFNTINQSIVKISNYENKNAILKYYEMFKEEKKCKNLNDMINNITEKKKKQVLKYAEGKEIAEGKENEVEIKLLETDKSVFNIIYNSLEEKNEFKEQIKKRLKNEISVKKEKIKNLMNENFSQYLEKFNKLQSEIKELPEELEVLFTKDIEDLTKLLQEQENNMNTEIGCCNIDNDLKQAIKIAKKVDGLKNSKFVEEFVKFIGKHPKKEKPEKGFFHFLRNEIWENRDILKSFETERLNTIFKSYEQKLTEEAKKELEEKWTNVDKYLYSIQNNDDRMSPTQSQISCEGKMEEKKIEICIEYIKDSYDSLCKEIKNGNNNENYEIMKKITKNRTSEFMNEMSKVILEIEESKNYDFFKEDRSMMLSNLKTILKMMTTKTNCPEFLTKFAKEIEELLKKYSMFEDRILSIVQENLDTDYEFYNEKLKNLTDEEIEKYVEKIEANFCFLSSIQNAFNCYFKPPADLEIRMEEIIEGFKEQMSKAEKEHEQALTGIFDRLDESVDGKIGFIPKIFDKLNAIKKKALFNIQKQISNHQKTINEKILNKVEEQKIEIKKVTEELILFNETKTNNIEKESSKLTLENELEFEKIYQIYELKKKEIEARFNMTNEKDENEMKRIKNELQAELQTNESSKKKREELLNEKYKDDLDKFIEKQDKELAEKEENVATNLIKCKKMQFINKNIHKLLDKSIENSCKRIIKDPKYGEKFFKTLERLENNFSNILIAERSEFAKFRNAKFQELTEKTNNEKEILCSMFTYKSITKPQSDDLSEFYKKFDKMQKEHIERYQNSGDRKIISILSSSIQERGRKLKELIQKSEPIRKESKVELLAEIFALWSISNAEKEKSSDECIFICFRAHAAQVICILILIAIESNETNGQIINKNRLAEVKTGEGKSIVLAMLSIYFALCGYEVDCICYSSILSKRDQSDFEDLFKHCGVESKISYGVFEAAIKKILNQQDGENKVSVTFEEFILQSVTSQIPISDLFIKILDKVPFLTNFFKRFRESFGKKLKNKILIIDEIDVLFNKKYFGDTFNLSIDLRDESIVTLLQFIWKRKDSITAKIVLKSPEFKAVTNKFPALTSVLENQVYGMILALKTYKEQQSYVIKDQTIYYKVEDSYSSDVSYRYNTTYLYFEEFEKNRVSHSALMKNMVINLCVAEFSYACILEYYTHILGVTGTLTCLPEYIKEFMDKNFGILKEEQRYIIPSVYGKNENKEIPEPICTSRKDYYDKIIENIKETFEKAQRPILVFFKSKTELINFHNSEKYKNWLIHTMIITEEHNEQDRNDRINRCSFKNSITLMTETFIRGTDFKLIDKSSEKAGGFHAIVTYLIDNTADYIQALGRVGRQGKPGSCISIFMKDDLEFLGLKDSSKEIEKISAAREKKQESEKESILERIKVSKKKNDETIKVFKDENFTLSKLANYILKNNLFPEVSLEDSKIKMILLIDATVSMGDLFVQLKLILPQIFDDVYQTLKHENVKGCLSLQILLYRNYNSPVEDMLQCSALEIQAENLKKFIDKSRVSGGWGNEAIEVALQYVNSLKEVNEIFIMGDARGNTKEEVISKRNTYKSHEKERLEKGYIPTTTEEQLDILVKNKIPINTFCLTSGTEENKYFKNLSMSTQGKYSQIELYKKTSSMQITTTIVERVLGAFGSKNVGEDISNALIEEYKKILSKRMNK